MIFVTLIPTCRNDGTPVSQAELDEIVKGFRERFGGATIDGQVEGYWLDTANGRHYFDKSLRLTVICEPERLHEAEEMVTDVGRKLDQRGMYFEVRYYDGVRLLRVPEHSPMI